MMQWLRSVSEGGLDLIEVQVALLEKRTQRLGIWLAVAVATGCAAGAGICGLLAAAVLSLAPVLGLAQAIGLISAIVLIMLLAGLWFVHRRISKAVQIGERDASRTRQTLGDLLTDDQGTGEDADASESKPGFISEAIMTVVSHPQLVSSIAFAAVSVFGVRRTFSMLRTASTMASAGAAASRLTEATRHEHPNGVHQANEPGSSSRSSRVRTQ